MLTLEDDDEEELEKEYEAVEEFRNPMNKHKKPNKDTETKPKIQLKQDKENKQQIGKVQTRSTRENNMK
ncbi:hypothetical protein JTB14_035843 [Gonioctena quinquepunctata]|nr:hypothetical protein JTB14_035843 [Gonioctena quinquepunctata]